MFIRPKKYIVLVRPEPPELGYVDIRTLVDSVCRYDLNDMDVAWLELTNEEFKEMGEKTALLPCVQDEEGLQVREKLTSPGGAGLHQPQTCVSGCDRLGVCVCSWTSGGLRRAPGSHPDLQPRAP